MTVKDDRTIDKALEYASEFLQDKSEKLDDMLSVYDLPEPNELSDDLWRVKRELEEVSALRSRRYHALVERTKG